MSSSSAAGERPASRLASAFCAALGSLSLAIGVAIFAYAQVSSALCLVLLGAGAVSHARFSGRRRRAAVFPAAAALVVVTPMFDHRFGDGLAPGTLILPPAGEPLRPTPTAVAA